MEKRQLKELSELWTKRNDSCRCNVCYRNTSQITYTHIPIPILISALDSIGALAHTHSHSHSHCPAHTTHSKSRSTRNAYSHKEIEIRACKIANGILWISFCLGHFSSLIFNFQLPWLSHILCIFPLGMLIMLLFPYVIFSFSFLLLLFSFHAWPVTLAVTYAAHSTYNSFGEAFSVAVVRRNRSKYPVVGHA